MGRFQWWIMWDSDEKPYCHSRWNEKSWKTLACLGVGGHGEALLMVYDCTKTALKTKTTVGANRAF